MGPSEKADAGRVRGEDNVKMEAEVGRMHSKMAEGATCQGIQVASKG